MFDKKKNKLYVDMDGVTVDFDGYAEEQKLDPEEIKNKPGAYFDMSFMAGAEEAINYLYFDCGYNIYLMTKPPTGVSHAYGDKAKWVFKNLPFLSNKLIITSDKSLVGTKDDILIDDRPEKANCVEFPGRIIKYGSMININSHVNVKIDWNLLLSALNLYNIGIPKLLMDIAWKKD